MSLILRHGILEQEILVSAPPGPAYPTADLKGRWAFDNQDLTDSYGSNDLTFDALNSGATGPNFATGKVGSYCADFSSGRWGGWLEGIDVSTCFGGSTQKMSLSYWVYIPSGLSPSPGFNWQCSRTSDTQYDWRTHSYNHSTVLMMGALYTDTTIYLNKSAQYTTNAWLHIVETYDPPYYKSYINSNLYDERTLGSLNMGPGNLLRLGFGYRVETRTSFYFTGKLDNIYLYGRNLTQSEVDQLYNGGDGV